MAQTVDMYRGGFDARRMLLQQALGAPAGGLSPFVALMQQNTRLIILTLEVGPRAACAAARAGAPSHCAKTGARTLLGCMGSGCGPGGGASQLGHAC